MAIKTERLGDFGGIGSFRLLDEDDNVRYATICNLLARNEEHD
jgi:hypothetical protein